MNAGKRRGQGDEENLCVIAKTSDLQVSLLAGKVKGKGGVRGG
jgi:hypothetical protein